MYYAVYLVFEDLSFRACARAIKPFVKRTHKIVWDWYQKIGSDESFHKMFRLGHERINIFAIDETGITISGIQVFMFIAYEPFEDRILELHFSWTANSISVEMFLHDLIKEYGRHPCLDGRRRLVLFCMQFYESQTSHLPSWLLAMGSN